ncbi:hypothetical protein [Acetivibrio ethanolgignens]|nr:hypothetical protein [Acetivibrio ethanolgignens]
MTDAFNNQAAFDMVVPYSYKEEKKARRGAQLCCPLEKGMKNASRT